MKKIHLLLLGLLMFSSGILAQSSSNSLNLKPTNYQKKVTIVISGKARSYYSLSSSEASVINVEGPGTLTVNSRVRFKPGDPSSLKYAISYRIDGGQLKTFTVSSTGRSKEAAYPDGTMGVPGQLRDFTIELLRGNHTVEFLLTGSAVNVEARYNFKHAKTKKQEWLAFSPVQPSEPIDIISKEIVTPYYRFSMEKPLKVSVIGPTELRVLTRTENQFQMKGTINYRVQVRENNIVLNTYQLHSKPSEVAVYKDVKDLIPGTAGEFVIYVPKGKHLYEIVLLDKDKSSLLGRILLPKKDVALEK